MSSEIIIQAKQLRKSYGDHTVVDDVSFEVYRGECFGLLGPNGAGKSTTMKMLYGSVTMTSGELYVFDLNGKKSMREIRTKLGVVPQDDGLDTDLSVQENLDIFGGFFGLSPDDLKVRTEETLRMTKLEEFRDRIAWQLSGGMRRRLAIARALLHEPDLMVLDEPTSGLDPQARQWIWDFLKTQKESLGSCVITTHYMEEAEHICDRIAIMDKGRFLTMGVPKDIIKEHAGVEVLEYEIPNADIAYYSAKLKQMGFQFQSGHNSLIVHIQESQNSKTVLDQVQGRRVTIRRPTLNDVFLLLSGRELRDEPL